MDAGSDIYESAQEAFRRICNTTADDYIREVLADVGAYILWRVYFKSNPNRPHEGLMRRPGELVAFEIVQRDLEGYDRIVKRFLDAGGGVWEVCYLERGPMHYRGPYPDDMV